jgi:hypothetical protein
VEAVAPNEPKIRVAALARVAQLFNLPASSLKDEMRFGDDLKASFVSDWRRNEFDQVLDDIRDVADAETLKALNAGILVITAIRRLLRPHGPLLRGEPQSS